MITLVEPWGCASIAIQVVEPVRTGCVFAVVIPVRNEVASLPDTLAALAAQRDASGSAIDPDRFEIILLVNNSDDGSAAAARAFASQHAELALHVVEIDLPEEDAHVGRARRLLMDLAAARLGPTGVIATTDADTVVAPDWIAMTLAEIAAGADAVAGRILVDPVGFAEHDRHAQLFHLRDVTYRYLVTEFVARLVPDPFDPWPRHFQHFGPSMAVTVETYRRSGGMPPLPSLEDVAFYDALRRIGARIRHSPAVRVVTSARPTGRTDFGFAVQLGRWSQMGARNEPFMVESVPAIIARLTGQPPTGEPLAPIETTIGDLRRLLSELRARRVDVVLTLEQIQPVRLVAAAD
jgi:hypothetical protein